MSIATLTPNATVTNSGTVVGAASAQAALADSSDASYVSFDAGEAGAFALTDLSLPAGAVIQQVVPQYRTLWSPLAPITVPPAAYLDTYLGAAHYKRVTTTVGWTTATWHYGAVIASPNAGVDILDAHVDATQLFVAAQYASYLVVYEMRMLVFYVLAPGLNITAPTGTLTTDTSPAVSWVQVLDSDGGPQTHFEVEILDGATIVSESGLIGSAANTWDIPVGLPDDTYTARVRIAQTVGGEQLWSGWDTQAFTIDVPSPGSPGLSLTPQDAQGRIMIGITDNPGAVSTTFFHVERSSDGQQTWDTVRATNPGGLITPVPGGTTVYDYDAPNGVLCDYRVHALHWFLSEGVISSSNSGYTKASVTWTSGDWWLKHPTRPSLSFHPTMRSAPSQSSEARQGVHYALNRSDPIVIADARADWTGQVSFVCYDDIDRAALDAILEDGQPVLLQGPPGVYWEDVYMAVGNHERSRPVDLQWAPVTYDTFTWIGVSPPLSELEE